MRVLAFRLKRIRCEFNIGFAVLVAAVCALTVWAGFWQLDRAAEEIGIRQNLETALRQPILHIFGNLAPPERLRYRQIRIFGHYLNDRQFLLDNKVMTGTAGVQVGYQVITPFVTDAGVLLVNRGWVPSGPDRASLPAVDVAADERAILGMVDVPGRSFRLGSMDSDTGWPRLIQYLDYHALAERLGREVYPAVIVLAAGSPDAYVQDWQPSAGNPQQNYSYAAQWFLMCAVLILMFLWFSCGVEEHDGKKRKRKQQKR
ncbi:MAG TPA: SURF1 family protein [Gammaproteobacteria bacterium]